MDISPLKPETLQDEGSKAINYIANYYENIHTYPVRSQVKPGYLKDIIPENAPFLPQSLDEILEDVDTKIVPGLTHWQSPNFYAFFPANASNAGLVGEILCSGLNVVGFNWISSPAATELETIVIDWMAKLLNLPRDFLFSHGGGGVIHGSTCESIVCTLSAARDEALRIHGEDKITKLVVYASDQTHFAYQKAAKLIGIPPRNFKILPTSSHNDFALSPDILRAAIDVDMSQGLVPLYVCATLGSTASGAVDPIDGLGQITREFHAWLHVDAAFAGSACICPEFRHYLNGVELANSISLNPHKWLLTNMDCTCLWLRSPKTLLDSLSTSPEILKYEDADFEDVIDYKDWQIALSRRFRALKLWIVIRRYGSNYLMNHIRRDVKLAEYFESLINDDKDKLFELVVPRKFSLVCFRLKSVGRDENATVVNKKLLEAINSSGQAYMTHAVIGGTFAIRCAIGGSLTLKCHIDNLWKLIQKKAKIILTKIK